MHELINRAQTSGSLKARYATYHYALCSWLCPECHAQAPRRDVEAQLWAYNYSLWSKRLVLHELERVERLLGHQPIVSLPE